MPRVTPSDRLPKLLDAAAAAFVEHGFQRTQMDDIAERLGVSKGTIYRAVDSKESLFAAVVEWGDTPDSAPSTGLNTPVDLAAVAAAVTAELTAAVATLELTEIVATRRRLRTADIARRGGRTPHRRPPPVDAEPAHGRDGARPLRRRDPRTRCRVVR